MARNSNRIAVISWTAYTLDAIIGIGAFILSFDTLTHLARLAGINPALAPIWPVVVDGIIVAATVAVYALSGKPKKVLAYPWILLMAGASVSTIGNAVHAVLTADGAVPVWVSASIAAVPPLALLAITHLTAILLEELPAGKQKAKRAVTALKPVPDPEPESAKTVPFLAMDRQPDGWRTDASPARPEPAPAVLV